MPERTSACPLDCPDTCSLTVRVEGERVVALEGDRRNPLTQGFMCAKVRRFPELVHGPERLRTPLRRVGPKGSGRFEPLDWEAALDLLCERLTDVRDRHGGEAILPVRYGGSNGSLSDGLLDARLFRRLGASQLTRTLCAAPSGAAVGGLYGGMPGVALTDYAQARLIVLWGVNPHASGIHLVPRIQEARREGAALVVVDPRRTPLAKQADLHLQPRPGTDLPLALAVLRLLFERGQTDADFLEQRCLQVDALRARAAPWTPARAEALSGVPAAAIEELAARYAAASPAVIRCGWGLERNRNGGSAVAAVLALPAVAGKFGVRGGGYTMSNSRAFPLAVEQAIGARQPATRVINMNQTGRALLEAAPPIRLLFVYDCNPLSTFPDQERLRWGLEREDLFTCVFEQVHTDTVDYADLVLPATTFLEHDELRRSYGAYALLRSRPAIPPVGEARANLHVFAELLERLGLAREGEPRTADALVRVLLREHPQALAELERDEMATPPCGSSPVQMRDVLPGTPDGKVHLLPPGLDAEAPQGLYGYQPEADDPRFPLALISPASTRAVSSTLYQLHPRQVPLGLHPADAAARGIEEGQPVRVWNDLGEVRTTARLDPDLAPGVALLPKGLWARHTANRRTSNALVPDTLTDLGGGACFNDARVQVARLAP